MILCVTASALMAKASPLPQGSGWNTTQSGQPSCHPYQWYNPRTASCQDYASASSCGYTAQVCGDGSFCTNNNGWSQNAFDWGCCPQGYVFDYNSGSCQSFMDIVGGCGSNLAVQLPLTRFFFLTKKSNFQACPDRQVCSIDPLYNGYQSGQEFGQTAAPWTVSCCPDTTQWDTKLNICRDFTSADSCGPNFEVHSFPIQS